MTMRWKYVQAEFVDESTSGPGQPSTLIAELMQRLATMLAGERAELEDRCAGGNQVTSEDLKQALRSYRAFFERLVGA